MAHRWTVAWCGAALLLYAGAASAQDTAPQPPPEGTAAVSPVTVDEQLEQPEQPPPSSATPIGTAAFDPNQPALPTATTPVTGTLVQPPPVTAVPVTAVDPNLPALVNPTRVLQPTLPPQVTPLTLTVDRTVARPDQPFTFTVTSTDANELSRRAIQVSIARDGKPFRTLRAEPDGRYRTALPPGSYEAQALSRNSASLQMAATARLIPRTSNRLSLRVMRANAPAEPEPAPEPTPAPEVDKPVAEPKPVETPARAEADNTGEPPRSVPSAVTAAPAPVPWLLIAAAALSLVALGGTVRYLRRPSARKQPPRDDADSAPTTPRLTSNTHVTHDVTFPTPPRLRFRISARAIPDRGRQQILPPSTPAPKLEDSDGRRADRP